MAMRNPYEQYKQNQVLTTPAEELVTMLYDGALRFMKQAKTALAEKNMEKTHTNIIKVQNIFTELMTNLDMNIEISHNLYNLYEYMHSRLVDANMQKDAAIVDEVIELVQDLRNTWEQAIKIARKG